MDQPLHLLILPSLLTALGQFSPAESPATTPVAPVEPTALVAPAIEAAPKIPAKSTPEKLPEPSVCVTGNSTTALFRAATPSPTVPPARLSNDTSATRRHS
jgi:hypothetical protein